MSGNPFGLSEISHFGSMQRVGGKAGGFINKKFFHPSSLRNQEKLWKAQTADATERRQQASLEKMREEERQVEALKKQMYLAGQGKSSADFFITDKGTPGDATDLPAGQKKEHREAQLEFQRRRNTLKREKNAAEKRLEAGEEDEAGEEGEETTKVTKADVPLAKSMYREDFHPNGHESVWGSWFDVEGKKWGFSCCKLLERKGRCPLVPEAPASIIPALAEPGRREKRRRRGNKDGNQENTSKPQAGGKAAPEETKPSDVGATPPPAVTATASSSSACGTCAGACSSADKPTT